MTHTHTHKKPHTHTVMTSMHVLYGKHIQTRLEFIHLHGGKQAIDVAKSVYVYG